MRRGAQRWPLHLVKGMLPMGKRRGRPRSCTQLMSDTDFDALKLKLRRENSIITAEGPRCSLTSRKMYSTAT